MALNFKFVDLGNRLELIDVSFHLVRECDLLGSPHQLYGFRVAVGDAHTASDAGGYVDLGNIFKLQCLHRAHFDA